MPACFPDPFARRWKSPCHILAGEGVGSLSGLPGGGGGRSCKCGMLQVRSQPPHDLFSSTECLNEPRADRAACSCLAVGPQVAFRGVNGLTHIS